MGISRTTERSEFYKELSPETQKEYFDIKLKKFMHTLDNIYTSIFIQGDGQEDIFPKLEPLLAELLEKKQEARTTKQPIPFTHGFNVMPYAFPNMYDVVLSEPELYDAGIRSSINLPNIRTNRIQLQLRAFGLWTRSINAMLAESHLKVQALLADYGLTISRIQENRIDYCYHTNIVSGVPKIFEKDGYVKHLKTKLQYYNSSGKVDSLVDGTLLNPYYYRFGSPDSSWCVKVYDKVREVITVGYKNFFFKMWHDDKLISYYDRYCFEYAFPHRNIDYLGKAKIDFYVKHGQDPVRVKMYETALLNKNTSLEEFNRMADEFMPPTTPVINIEYTTKRDFYSPSDNTISSLSTLRKDYPPMLKRIYQIIDNRSVFLNYLHGDGFSFCNGINDEGLPNYLSWWQRLRNTKVGGIKSDEKILREYAYNMDKNLVARQLMSKTAAFAVYNDRLDTDYSDDNDYSATFITDNYKHKMDELYVLDKQKKNRQIKNRKKQQEKNLAALAEQHKQSSQGNPLPEPVQQPKLIDGTFYAEVLDENDHGEQLPEDFL